MEQNFDYNSLPVRTVTDENEETWFAGIDVCNILEYQNATDIIEKKLDEDEKKLDYLTDSSGQRRKTWTINESGLYSLALCSSKPEAKAFKRWITHDVLPAIRKAGKYTTEQDKEHELKLRSIADEIQKLKDDKDEYQKKVNDLKRDIETKMAEMIFLIKKDKNQLRIQFPEA
jgi:prophage antirepressor-like protein